MYCNCGSNRCVCKTKCKCETYFCGCFECRRLCQVIVKCRECGLVRACQRCAKENTVTNKCKCILHENDEVCCLRPAFPGAVKESSDTISSENSALTVSASRSSEAPIESEYEFIDDLNSSEKAAAEFPRRTLPQNKLESEEKQESCVDNRSLNLAKSHKAGCSIDFSKHSVAFKTRSRESSESSSSIEVIPEDETSSFENPKVFGNPSVRPFSPRFSGPMESSAAVLPVESSAAVLPSKFPHTESSFMGLPVDLPDYSDSSFEFPTSGSSSSSPEVISTPEIQSLNSSPEDRTSH